MNRNHISILVIVVATIVMGAYLVLSQDGHDHSSGGHGHDDHGGHDDHEEEMARGPHGGRLLEQDGFALEMTIFESGIPPEFHIYPYLTGEPVSPGDVNLNIKLHRTGGVTDNINFIAQADHLKGDTVIYEPHSFEVEVIAQHQGKTYQWRYDNFEGRTQISDAMAKAMGIKTEIVGPVSIKETRTFAGQVHLNPNYLSRVRPRFAGVVKSVRRELGEIVTAGDTLASVQSNESLQTYRVKAPINGLIVKRDIQVGESTGNAPLFVIADLSTVWVELDIFSRDMDKVKPDQEVVVESLDGKLRRTGIINWISPLAVHASQSVRARVEIKNADGLLRPGQFMRGHVTIAQHPVDLAVRQSGIQAFRDFQVVYAKFGDTYEVRMLELGRRNKQWVEVLGGIKAGTDYVTENSYLIKADIEKSGASHDH